jgi:hypothetical protein
MTEQLPDLDHFDHDDAWRIGNALVARCRGESASVTTRPSGTPRRRVQESAARRHAGRSVQRHRGTDRADRRDTAVPPELVVSMVPPGIWSLPRP